jgi:hypothetical protein
MNLPRSWTIEQERTPIDAARASVWLKLLWISAAGLIRKGNGESLPQTCFRNPYRQLWKCTDILGNNARGAQAPRKRARTHIAGALPPLAVVEREWNVVPIVSAAAATPSKISGKTEAGFDIRCKPLGGAPLQSTWGPPFSRARSRTSDKGKSVFCRAQAGKWDRIQCWTSTMVRLWGVRLLDLYENCDRDHTVVDDEVSDALESVGGVLGAAGAKCAKRAPNTFTSRSSNFVHAEPSGSFSGLYWAMSSPIRFFSFRNSQSEVCISE